MKLSSLVVALAAAFSLPAGAATINVSGTSNPWLAGMPNGSSASSGDSAPAESPVFAGNVAAGSLLTFTISIGELVGNCPGCTALTADGDGIYAHGIENGISDVNAPLNSLVGVFLDSAAPNDSTAPSSLNFGSSGLGTSFATLSPELKQVFFIGDGLTATGSGSLQTFLAPTGATRLYLGTMDGYGWFNNVGYYSVSVAGLVPEPESYAMLLAGLGLLGAVARRSKTS